MKLVGNNKVVSIFEDEVGLGTTRLHINSALYSFVNRESDLQEQLLEKGPLAVSVDATVWRHYRGGVIQHHCRGNVNHEVLMVGYRASRGLEILHC